MFLKNNIILQIMNIFWQQALGELIGSMILIIFANGVGFSTTHSKMFANSGGRWILVAFGCGFAVFIAVIIAQAFKALGMINPAVAIYESIKSKNPLILGFIPFQLVGAIIGQCVLDLMNWKFILVTAKENNVATLNSHCTNPAISNKDKATFFNFMYEFVGTAILISVIFVLSILNNQNKILDVFWISITVVAIGISLGSATGYAINPARDLGPRIVYQIIKPLIDKKTNATLASANWSYSWVPIFAPSIASCFIGLFTLI